MNGRYCANPDHIRASGRDAPSLTFSDEDCFYRDSDEPGSECIPGVLVPVTQREAEEKTLRDIIAVLDAAQDSRASDDEVRTAVNFAARNLRALAAVQGISVDTEAIKTICAECATDQPHRHERSGAPWRCPVWVAGERCPNDSLHGGPCRLHPMATTPVDTEAGNG